MSVKRRERYGEGEGEKGWKEGGWVRKDRERRGVRKGNGGI